MIDYSDTVFAEHRLRMKQTSSSKPVLLSDKGLVLVIGECPTMAEALSDVLHSVDYEIVSAPSGQEAMETVEERRDEISLLILDMNMPGLNGEETLKALQGLNSHVKVIVSSAPAEAEVKQRYTGYDGLYFLPKPYELEAARELVQTALAA